MVSDFSKALSLSGLRIGWIIDADAERREHMIDLRSYFTVSSSPLTEAIGAFALSRRGRYSPDSKACRGATSIALQRFLQRQEDVIGWLPPSGGTVTFPWLRDGRDARPLCETLARAGVLVAPGDCFSVPDHFRIGLGAQSEGFEEALGVFERVLDERSR